jgi:hypothetical protein
MLHMLQASIPNVLSVSDIYCKRFIWMLHTHIFQVFYLYVVYVCNDFQGFPGV